jgi:hypothetical protein
VRSRQPEERQTAEKALPRLALNLAFSDVVDFVIEMKIVDVDRVECIAGNVDELHGRRIPARSQRKELVVNPESSVDAWFGPTASAGHEANWVETVPGKGWNVLFRREGPLQPWFDKT